MAPNTENDGAYSGRATMQPGTIRRALTLAAVIAAGVGVVAAFWPQPAMRSPVETYLRQGFTRGGEALGRDLMAETGLGGDAGPAVQRLISMGFSCNVPSGQTGEWVCLFRRPYENRNVLSVEARVQVERGAVAGTSARIWEMPMR